MIFKVFFTTVFCLLFCTNFIFVSEASKESLQLQQLNLTCANHVDCHSKIGNDSVCYEHSCICDLGFRLLTSHQSSKCTQYDCDPLGPNNQTAKPDACWRMFKDTVCSEKNHLCVCDQYHQLDEQSQLCTGKGPEKEHFPWGLLIGLLILGGLLVGAVAIYFTMVRRRRSGYN